MKQVTNQAAKIAELKATISQLKKESKAAEKAAAKELERVKGEAKTAIRYGVSLEYAGIINSVSTAMLPYVSRVLQGHTIHPVSSGYSKGYAHVTGGHITGNVMAILDKHQIKYVNGNDAPRGGAAGAYLRLWNDADQVAADNKKFADTLAKITVDEQYITDRMAITGKQGKEKNEAQQKAFSGLLHRCSVVVDSKDYWNFFSAVNS